jgi:hypothetical protein
MSSGNVVRTSIEGKDDGFDDKVIKNEDYEESSSSSNEEDYPEDLVDEEDNFPQ